MRRIVASILCLLVLTATGGSAAADPVGAGAEAATGAGSWWWRHGPTHGTVYFLDAFEFVGTFSNGPIRVRAYFGSIPCEVGRRGGPTDCKNRQAKFRRVKVDSFEIDPLLNSAHVVVHSGAKRGEVTWTGRGDYYEPFVWQSVGQLFAPPYFAHGYANVIAVTGRNARATGDLFGLDLKRSEFMDAGMTDFVFAHAGACLTGPWC